MKIGDAYQYLGDYKKAIGNITKALAIAKKNNLQNTVERCYGLLGTIFRIKGDYNKAIEYYQKAVSIAIKLNDQNGIASFYSNIAISQMFLNNYNQSIEYHEKAIEILRKTGYKIGECRALLNASATYKKLGNFEKSLEYSNLALDIAELIDDKIVVLNCLGNLGDLARELGNMKEAIKMFERKLELSRQTEYLVGIGQSYTDLGTAYLSKSNFKKSKEFLKKGLLIKRKIGDVHGELICNLGLGAISGQEGDFENSIEFSKQALDIAKKVGDIFSEGSVYYNLGNAYYSTDKKKAYSHFENSIKLHEMVGESLVEESHKIHLYGNNPYAYQKIISLCLDLNKKEKAFEFVERSKSRAFLDLISSSKITPTVKLTKEFKLLLEKEKSLLNKIQTIQLRHLQNNPVTTEIGEVESIQIQLEDVHNKISKIDTKYVMMRRPNSISIKDIQMILSKSPKTMIVEYFIMDDSLIIFVLYNKKLILKSVKISREMLFALIFKFRNEITNSHSLKYKNLSSELENYLLEPISEFLKKSNMIYFVPYDILHYIPFGSLRINEEPLIKNHSIAILPNSSLLPFLQNKTKTRKKCVVFGVDFPLEAEYVAQIFNTEPFIDANKSTVLENLDHQILHFSCHGKFDEKEPLSSGIKLKDGILTAREIFGLKIKSNFVALSACQTGINQRTPGDELIGLSRPILYAGVSSILVSLWEVDSIATQELMKEFYHNLKNGHSVSKSLQFAQNTMSNNPVYSHPYYWAAFIIIGNSE